MPARKPPVDFAKVKKHVGGPAQSVGAAGIGDPSILIDLILSRSAALLAAGITSLSVGGISVTLAPPPAAPEEPKDPPPATQHSDPLMDPASYVGGRVPGFTRPKGDS